MAMGNFGASFTGDHSHVGTAYSYDDSKDVVADQNF